MYRTFHSQTYFAEMVYGDLCDCSRCTDHIGSHHCSIHNVFAHGPCVGAKIFVSALCRNHTYVGIRQPWSDDLVQELGKKLKKDWLVKAVKTLLVLALAAFFVVGLGNFKAFYTVYKTEKIATEQVVNSVGEVPEDTVLVTNNVKHLGWTVLYYYYPDRDIITGRCSEEGMEHDKFWYFTPESIDKGELKEMTEAGYTVEKYGHQQIAVYPFEMYYFERVK